MGSCTVSLRLALLGTHCTACKLHKFFIVPARLAECECMHACMFFLSRDGVHGLHHAHAQDVEWSYPRLDHFIATTSEDAKHGSIHNFNVGAFANHWHGDYTLKIRPGTWAHVFHTAYDDFLQGKTTNMFGEKYDRSVCGGSS